MKKILLLYLSVLITYSYAQSKLDIIVLDAGHGGKDPGTISLNRTEEKDIVLPITIKLGELIRTKYPDIKIIYTRTDDNYPELRDRTSLANSSGAKLFISIHANYKKKEETAKKGFEIYILNRERFPEALTVTLKENIIIKTEQNTRDTLDRFIFFNLVQNGMQRLSEMIASSLEYNFLSFTDLESRGVRQAGFWVNMGSSMPSVLVECGYLSDPDDEKYLTSTEGQQKIAEALFQGFVMYKNNYEMNY